MKKLLGILFVLLILCYFAVYVTFLSIPAAEVFNEALPVSKLNRLNIQEENVFGFIYGNLLGGDGEIYTNVQKYDGSRDTLSESVGLLMNYCVLSEKKELFEKELNFLNDRMLTDGQFIKWRLGAGGANCNASIDDLRIIRALLDASDRWGSKEYYNMAGLLQLSIFQRQVNERNLYELYDWKSGKGKHSTPLCYLDLYTIDRMSEYNTAWLAVEDRALSIVSNGRIGGKSPFFYKYYDYDTNSYSLDGEYEKEKQKGICLTYTLYTVLHLAEVNEDTGFFTEWLKGQVEKGKLFAWYDPVALKPASTIESTAVYALAAVYAEKTGEKQLYGELIDKMLKFMVSDPKSAYFGGFGDAELGYFHSFDNLTALWALSVGAE